MPTNRLTILTSAVALASLAGTADAQSINLQNAHRATLQHDGNGQLDAPAAMKQVPHARQSIWTRIVMQPDELGHMHAVCSVEQAPHAPKARTTRTNQPTRK